MAGNSTHSRVPEDAADATLPEPRSRATLVAAILAGVADEFGLSVREMMARGRRHAIWRPRMAAMYCTRILTDFSLPELGRTFGRSHSTVLRAVNRCSLMMERDEHWAARMDALTLRLATQSIAARR